MANPCITNQYPSQCACYNGGVLEVYHKAMGEQTGGTTFELTAASEVSKTIKDIIVTVYPPDSLSKIDIGSAPPRNIRIRAYDILVPLPTPGEFVKAFIYQWP